MIYRLIPFITLAIAFLADRISKSCMLEGDFGIISFIRICNRGAAFGILQNQIEFLSVFSFLVIIGLSIYVIRKHSELNRVQMLGLGLILGGTAGNLFDRLSYGYVVDFIRLNFVDFPIFNLADVFINVGVIVVLAISLLRKN